MLKYSLISLLLASSAVMAADPVPTLGSPPWTQDPIPSNITVLINREVEGTGVPGQLGFESNLFEYNDGTFALPQYLPGHPTAATLYPRVVDVKCLQENDVVTCEGYHWTPDMGRAEYLLVHPVIKQAPPVKVVIQEKIILKEVPVKKKRE